MIFGLCAFFFFLSWQEFDAVVVIDGFTYAVSWWMKPIHGGLNFIL